MSNLISWLFPVILGEMAVLFFMWFRLVYRSRLLQALLAVFAVFSLIFCLLAVAVYLSAAPLVFSARDQAILIGVSAGLFILIAIFARTRELPETGHPYWSRRWEEKVARREARGESERKKPSPVRAFFTCLVVGVVLAVILVLGIGALTIAAP